MNLSEALEIIHGEHPGAPHAQWEEAARLLSDRGLDARLERGIQNLIWALLKQEIDTCPLQ
jgi:hypothetical protein